MKLGSWLIARGKISGVQLKRALLDQSFYGGYLSSSLLKLGYIDERTLGEYLSDAFQVPYAPAPKFKNIPPEILRTVPHQLAEKHQIVPLALAGRKLQLAMMNPRDVLVIDEVAFLTGLQVEPHVSSETLILGALERYYRVPRSVRETIPLADRIGELQEAPGADRPEPFFSSFGEQPTPSSPLREEVGIDGPLLTDPAEDSEALSSGRVEKESIRLRLGADVSLPSNITEWREPGEAVDPAHHDGPKGTGTPPAPESRPFSPKLPEPSTFRADAEATPIRTSPGLRASLSLVPSVPPGSLEDVAQRLRDSGDRDGIFDALLGFCAQRFLRTALFLVHQDKVVGWSGRGEGFEPARIRAAMVPFSRPSIFSYFRMGSDFYFGPVPELPANRQFYRELSLDPPQRVLLIPILIKDRLIAILYGDNGAERREEPDVALYRRLAQKVSLALEILILRNKITMS